MTLPSLVIAPVSALLVLLLLLIHGQSERARFFRACIHTAALLGFGLAGWYSANDGDFSTGYAEYIEKTSPFLPRPPRD